ncbi:hypothetical protein B0T14DRAFT_434504, partial [Immersiella caudata]
SKTYNTKDSLVVTDPATCLVVTGLSGGERTRSRAFLCAGWEVSSVIRVLPLDSIF